MGADTSIGSGVCKSNNGLGLSVGQCVVGFSSSEFAILKERSGQ